MKRNLYSFYRMLSLAAIFWTTVSMSAYTPHETGSRVTASGEKAKEGYTCAANFVPIGSVIIYEGHKYYVQDRMNPKYNRHVDLFMESHKKALQFGRKDAKVQVITPGDSHMKLPKDEKTVKHVHKTDGHKQTAKNPEQTVKEQAQTTNEEKPQAQAKEIKIRQTADNSSHSRRPVAAPVIKPQARP
jgi:3D (Asp-Asp-Asp) domain-containing protein